MKEDNQQYADPEPEIIQPPSYLDRTNSNYSIAGQVIDRKPDYNLFSSLSLQMERFRGCAGKFWKW